jgi:RNA polymerase sigma-70 factor (ECF subfamily)
LNELFLFKKIKQGDRKAFDTLFRLYYKRLFGYCWKYVQSKEAAEDIVQKVFIQLWMKRNLITITDSVPAYLYTSVRNQSFIYLKSFAVRKTYEAQSADGLMQDNQENDDVFKRFPHIIRQKVADLPDKCRDIFTMARFEGLTYDEIAEYLKVSKKTVENQMTIAYKKLREWLQPELKKILENS